MLNEKSALFIDDLISRYSKLAECKESIIEAAEILTACARRGGTILIGGNGGSSADSDHIVGELMKGFILKRELVDDDQVTLSAFGEEGELLAQKLQYGIKAISLSEHSALSTAVLNDNGQDLAFAQAVYNYAGEGDVLIAISTSGNARNLRLATLAAKAKHAKSILLTGKSGGALATLTDVAIKVPETETYLIQELYFPVYHTLCIVVENELFS